jgi:hypothetical protein
MPRGDAQTDVIQIPSRPSNSLPVLLALLVVTLAATWLATYGTWRLFQPEVFGCVYDAQAASFLQGRWDVPREVLRTEGFTRDGKWYSYFGVFPALLRVPLMLAMPEMAGRWSRLFVVCASMLTSGYALLILRTARKAFSLSESARRAVRWIDPLFVVLIGLGSTVIFLPSRSFPHHEAPAWGAAMALASFYHLLKYLAGDPPRKPIGHLSAAAIFAVCAFFSRPTIGGGPIAALLLLGFNALASRHGFSRRPAPAASRSAAMVPLCAVALTMAAYVGVNYARFRTLAEGAPLYLHEETARDPERMARTGGRLMHLSNVRTNLLNFALRFNLEFSPHFPWVFAPRTAAVFPDAKIDSVEWFGSAIATMPLLCALSVLGIRSLRRPLTSSSDATPWIPMLGALAGAGALLPVNFISHRYVHDFLPWLVVSGAFGIHTLLTLRSRQIRHAAWTLALAAGAFSVYVNCALAITYQRVLVWGVPHERRVEFWQLRTQIDRTLFRAFGADLTDLPAPPDRTKFSNLETIDAH